MNVIIFGPPGAGKGTQSQKIINKYKLYQVSTGDLLRDEIKKNTETGKKIATIINNGNFVTDDIVNNLLEKVVSNPSYRNKIIFDGYPRNIEQAKNLELILNKENQSINFVFFLKVSKEIIEKRILGRVVCEKCNTILNEYFDKNELKNHICGNKYLMKRQDDNLETIINRYEDYMKKTKPVLDFYSTRTYFYEIDGSQKIQVITDKIDDILKV